MRGFLSSENLPEMGIGARFPRVLPSELISVISVIAPSKTFFRLSIYRGGVTVSRVDDSNDRNSHTPPLKPNAQRPHHGNASYLRGKRYNQEKTKGHGAKSVHQNDGQHTAERLAKEYGVSKPTIERDGKFAEAVDTIERRRNPTTYASAELALKLEPLIAAKAKANQGTRNDIRQKSDGSGSVETKKELAKVAGVSHDALAKLVGVSEGTYLRIAAEMVTTAEPPTRRRAMNATSTLCARCGHATEFHGAIERCHQCGATLSAPGDEPPQHDPAMNRAANRGERFPPAAVFGDGSFSRPRASCARGEQCQNGSHFL